MSNVGVNGPPATESAIGEGAKRRGRRAAVVGTRKGTARFRANAAIGVPVLAVTAAAGIALAAQAGAFDGLTGKAGLAAADGSRHAADSGQDPALPEPGPSGSSPDSPAQRSAAKEPKRTTTTESGTDGSPTDAGAVRQEAPVTAGSVQPGNAQGAAQPTPQQAAAPADAAGSPSGGSTSGGTEPVAKSSEAATAGSGAGTSPAPAPSTAPAPAPSTSTAPGTSTSPSTSTEPATLPALITSVLGATPGTGVLIVGGSLLGR
ncbi:hypothetical protein [Arthrobacter silvisoli]|uniref:hypothetical protein n=1 Tax=Arthrobacter silvisoli TaxID=2291022 RepID=UPI000E214089|nr:hypothetical protein [Arthrobacter silvisoli]